MEREIKFRAFCGEHGMQEVMVGMGSVSTGFGSFEEPLPPVMQYTGVKDTEGKEIYEGDLVVYEDERMLTDSGVYQVGWDKDNAGWGLKGEYDDRDDKFESSVAGEVMGLTKVIGNIHENANLVAKMGN